MCMGDVWSRHERLPSLVCDLPYGSRATSEPRKGRQARPAHPAHDARRSVRRGRAALGSARLRVGHLDCHFWSEACRPLRMGESRLDVDCTHGRHRRGLGLGHLRARAVPRCESPIAWLYRRRDPVRSSVGAPHHCRDLPAVDLPRRRPEAPPWWRTSGPGSRLYHEGANR